MLNVSYVGVLDPSGFVVAPVDLWTVANTNGLTVPIAPEAMP